MVSPAIGGTPGVDIERVLVDDVEVVLSFHGDATPVEVVGRFLRDLARVRFADGFGYDELIDIAVQLDGGEGS